MVAEGGTGMDSSEQGKLDTNSEKWSGEDLG